MSHSANEESNFLKEEFISDLITFLREKKPSKDEIAKKKVELCKKHKVKKIPTDIEVYLNLNNESSELKNLLQTKPIRTGSGVAVVALMTFPSKCPHGKCTYCPGGEKSFFGDVPQSYTGNEPATMRGIRNNYDAYLQVFNRLEQYVAIGQSPEKVELIIMGGTFIASNKDYQENFVKDSFNAMNDFSDLFYDEEFLINKFKEFFELPGSIQNEERGNRIRNKILCLKEKNLNSLETAQKKNESSRIKCVGLTIETKPDQGFKEQGLAMLKLGCTRVELGVQTLKNDVLKKVGRGHSIEDTKKSIKELKDLGFKLNFHMMPGLPGTSIEEDKNMFIELFYDPDFRPDMLKIYPLMVMPGTKIHDDYKKGTYEPLSTTKAIELLSESLPLVPEYCRIMRVQRDIPPKYAVAGVDRSNLRQMVDEEIKNKKLSLKEIRAKEIKTDKIKEPIALKIINYGSSGGKEFFISLNDANDKLLGFVRLRFPSSFSEEITKNSCLIRELHVYGAASPIKLKDSNVQHRGFGRSLMEEAEKIAKKYNKNKVIVISGIGVRSYYEKLGYKQENYYMTKNLK